MNNVLLEIGMEELPARFIDNAEKQLQKDTATWLKDVNIAYGTIKTFSTPRRLAILIEDVSDEQATIEEEVRGPQLKIAKDDQGNWTKAAIGFTKGQGKAEEDIYTKKINGNEYIFVNKVSEGKKSAELMPELQSIINGLHFPQTMKWGNNTYHFPRPIRWIVALFNEEVISLEAAGVKASNISYGHRFLGKQFTIQHPVSYEKQLLEEYVVADVQKREALILEGIEKLENENGFEIAKDLSLLHEVRNLVEYPTVFFGSFEETFLSLPDEVLITSMKEHQRYFPVLNKQSKKLLPYFVSVRNGNDYCLDNVAKGNEKVLRARLSDASFFYKEDQTQSINFYNEKLKKVIFQEKIGTIYEKTVKVKQIAALLLEHIQPEKEVREAAIRAAEIAKFDLVTNMVNEFTELQGVMGEKYALIFGEGEKTAKAIREQYLPQSSDGALPESIQGAVVSIADKLDTIVGCFSVGIIPTGSQDPYGLRRQAIGILRIAEKFNWKITIENLISIACDVYQADHSVFEKTKQFFIDRTSYLFSDKSLEQDVIKSVLKNQIGIYHYAAKKAEILSAKRNDESFKTIEEALVRIMNIANKAEHEVMIDTSLFETDSETKLFTVYNEVSQRFSEAETALDAEGALDELAELAAPIHSFFDHNMVMADDEQIKQNRLSLATSVSALIAQYADLRLIEWKQHFK